MKKAAVIFSILVALLMTSCGRADNTGIPEATDVLMSEITDELTPELTDELTPEPTDELTPESTGGSTPEPTEVSTPEATDALTPAASDTLMPEITDVPTPGPTEDPTPEPTETPTKEPAPTAVPTERPKPTQTASPEPTPEPTATQDPFGYIERAVSPVDFNGNGIDDYTDILIGAKKDAANHPRYDGSYQANGYPPDNVGVCSDVVWRAFREAGYSLRYMVDKDIRDNSWRYPMIAKGKEKRDNKIDFRRVRNLRIFFDEYAVILTTDIDEIEEWQPGDIVIFYNNSHIGIVSDKRNEQGRPYIIHNGGQAQREEDYLGGDHTVAAHYRFDASRVPEEMLIPWEG